MVWVFSALGCGAAPEPAERPDTVHADDAPDLAALRVILAQHGARSFDGAAQARGCPSDATLAHYLDLLVSTASPDPASSDVLRLTGGCDAGHLPRIPIDPPLDPAYWDCRIHAYASGEAGESPWHYELRLRVRRSDRTVDLDNFSCPGAG